jgi:hypothetical protein
MLDEDSEHDVSMLVDEENDWRPKRYLKLIFKLTKARQDGSLGLVFTGAIQELCTLLNGNFRSI